MTATDKPTALRPMQLTPTGGLIPDAVYTITQIAARFSVSESYIRRLCRSKELPSRKVGRDYRVKGQDAEQWYDGPLQSKKAIGSESTEASGSSGGQPQTANVQSYGLRLPPPRLNG